MAAERPDDDDSVRVLLQAKLRQAKEARDVDLVEKLMHDLFFLEFGKKLQLDEVVGGFESNKTDSKLEFPPLEFNGLSRFIFS
jgi:hypothetical protein